MLNTVTRQPPYSPTLSTVLIAWVCSGEGPAPEVTSHQSGSVTKLHVRVSRSCLSRIVWPQDITLKGLFSLQSIAQTVCLCVSVCVRVCACVCAVCNMT